MKSSVIAASLLATLALAKPLEKRYIVTNWQYETVTVTVTGTDNEFNGHFRGTYAPAASTPASVSTVPTSTPVAVVPTTASVSTPVQSSAPAWTASSVAPSKASSAAAAPSASDVSGPSDYATNILKQHNLHRANHSAPALSWDDNMASIAAKIASSCVYAHDTSTGGGGYGQNIGAGAQPADIPAMITNQMYNGEVGWYPGYGGEPSMSDFEHWGHFSQIVWASTTGVGCATQYCPGGLANTGGGVSPYFTVCNYSPAGNFGGQYGKNVLAPVGAATVSL